MATKGEVVPAVLGDMDAEIEVTVSVWKPQRGKDETVEKTFSTDKTQFLQKISTKKYD